MYVKRILTNECKKVKSNEDKELNGVQDEPIREPDDDFLVLFTQNSQRRSSIDNDIESEVSRFLVDDRKENSILNEYPSVREIYFKFNTTLSSSAPVERVFSQSQMIFTPRRNRISNDHFEQALLLKHNRKLLSENNIQL